MTSPDQNALNQIAQALSASADEPINAVGDPTDVYPLDQNLDVRQAIKAIYRKTHALATLQGRPGSWKDDQLGHTLSIRQSVINLHSKVDALEKKIDKLLGGGSTPTPAADTPKRTLFGSMNS